VDTEVVIAMKGQHGVVQEAYVNMIVLIVLPVADTMNMIIDNAITTMFIGMTPITTDKIKMKSADLIIVIPGDLIIVQEAMFTNRELVMIRVALEAPVTVTAKQIRT
jgi:hypothetical protein